MALLFLDSFDHYLTAHLTRKWTENELGSSAGYILPTGGRRGGGCLRLDSPGWNVYVNKTIAPAPTSTTAIVGCAFRYVTFPNFFNPIVMIGESQGAHVGWGMDTDGTLRVVYATGQWGVLIVPLQTTTLATVRDIAMHQNVWYYVELKSTISSTVGTWNLRVNEVSLSSGTGAITRNPTYPGTGQWNIVGLHQYSYSTYLGGSYDIDDLYVCDGSGSFANDFLGDVQVIAHHPSGAGASAQFTPTSGSNYQMVDDETPDDDTTVNASSTVGNEDLFAMATMANPTGTIYGLQIVGGYEKDESGTAQVQQALRIGETTYYSSTKSPSSASYYYEMDCYGSSPASGTLFTAEEFNSIQAGYKQTA